MARTATARNDELAQEQPAQGFVEKENERRAGKLVQHFREGDVHGSVFTNSDPKGDFETFNVKHAFLISFRHRSKG